MNAVQVVWTDDLIFDLVSMVLAVVVLIFTGAWTLRAAMAAGDL